LYPSALTRAIQIGIAAFVVAVNLYIYGHLLRSRKGRRTK
jgi:hypothetical protein